MKQFTIREFRLSCPDYGEYDCAAPCSLYSVLYEHGAIEDPFYGENERKYLHLADRGCTFRAEFDVDAAFVKHRRQRLALAGIDTLAEISFNGSVLGRTENMHRSFAFDVKGLLRAGKNTLILRFDSPTEYVKKQNEAFELWSPDCSLDGYGHIRKMYCSYGWDWGPVIPDIGIYRAPALECGDAAEIRDVAVRQEHEARRVLLRVRAELDDAALCDEVRAVCTAPDGTQTTCVLEGGAGALALDDPRLWYPRGYGDQPLYTLRVCALRAGRVVSEKTLRVGLRTLTVSQERDVWGNEFCFVVNGRKIFAMGADYIPSDALLGRVTAARTRRLLEDCAAANFNTVRVWGGGNYPDDDFYDCCDELGLIVWQDFMFACSTIRLTDAFEANVRAEAEEVCRRLRSHACLGLLCGNNEVEQAWNAWNLPDQQRQKTDYIRLFERILPELCGEFAPDTFYWPSSPSTYGSFVEPNSQRRGDAHCWEIWHGSEPFEAYREKFFRFCSEYGYEAFPSPKTLAAIGSGADLNPFSPVMDVHQKCAGGNPKIVAKTSEYYPYAFDTADFVYVSQLMQAEAIRCGAEHFRRNRGRCMGSIYWQLNDNWPTASWSSIDYFGRWKALHYYARRFYAPVLLSVAEEQGKLVFNVSNETLGTVRGCVLWRLTDAAGETVSAGEIPVEAPPLTAVALPPPALGAYAGRERELALVYRLATADAETVPELYLFVKPKFFAFRPARIRTEIAEREDRLEITLESDVLAKDVALDFDGADAVFSDNYFCLGTERRVVTCPKIMSAEEARKRLTVRCVNDLIG